MVGIGRALLASALLLSGGACIHPTQFLSNPDAIVRQSAEFNEAIAESERQFVVQNVLRARDRESMTFARFSTLHNSITREASGGVSATVMEGGNNDTLGPSFNLTSSAAPYFALDPQNTQEFNRAINSSVELGVYHLLQESGWQPALLHTLFIERLTLSCKFVRDFARRSSPEDISSLQASLSYCGATGADGEPDSERESITLYNWPSSWGAYEQFYAWLRVLMSGDIHLQVCKETVATIYSSPYAGTDDVGLADALSVHSAEGLEWAAPNPKAGRGNWGLQTSRDRYFFGLGCAGTRFSTTESEFPDGEREQSSPSKNTEGSITIRSLDGVLHYLGEVVRVQDGGLGPVGVPLLDVRKCYGVWVPTLLETEDDLFRLTTDAGASGVSVRHHGVTYTAAYAPLGAKPLEPDNRETCDETETQTDADATSPDGGDRSQQVIALVIQVLGMLQSRDEIPTTTAVVVN